MAKSDMAKEAAQNILTQFLPCADSNSMHAEFGAWYPRFNNWNMHRPWDRFKNDMTELFDKRLKSTEARVLWRAYGPTHFGGPTGESLSVFQISPWHFT